MMKTQILIGLFVCHFLAACTSKPKTPYLITYKSVILENPAFSQYHYSSNGWDYCNSIDSTCKYKIGEYINK